MCMNSYMNSYEFILPLCWNKKKGEKPTRSRAGGAGRIAHYEEESKKQNAESNVLVFLAVTGVIALKH